MTNRPPAQREKPPAISRGRHEYNCSVCSHQQREEIERDFVNWVSPATSIKAWHEKLGTATHTITIGANQMKEISLVLKRM